MQASVGASRADIEVVAVVNRAELHAVDVVQGVWDQEAVGCITRVSAEVYFVPAVKAFPYGNKSHEIHMGILCAVPISHVLSTCERNAKR